MFLGLFLKNRTGGGGGGESQGMRLATELGNEAIRTSAQYFFSVFIIPANRHVETTADKDLKQNPN